MRKLSDTQQKLRAEKIDLAILARGGIRFYHQTEVLDYDVALLAGKDFHIIEIDGQYLKYGEELFYHLEDKLNVPDLHVDLSEGIFFNPDIARRGVVIVFRDMKNPDPEAMHLILNYLACESRYQFAYGQKLLTLVQISNPKYKIEKPIGAINGRMLNDLEWGIQF